MKTDRILLQILKAVNYTNTISEVADKLYLSQPYISNLLKKTEETYHTTLINRRKPISLTTAGRTMIHGLQAVIIQEDRLAAAIEDLTPAENKPIIIGITDPFLSSKVTLLTSTYAHNHLKSKLEIRLLPDNADPEELRDLDIVIGEHLLGDDFTPSDLPMRLLYLFVSENCDGYQSDQIFQPYSSTVLKSLNTSTYIGLADHGRFQRYVEMSFQKASLSLTTNMLVPTPADALRAVATTPDSTTITTLENAKQVFPQLNFNLIELPSNFIALDTTINVRRDPSMEIQHLAIFLQAQLAACEDHAPALINAK